MFSFLSKWGAKRPGDEEDDAEVADDLDSAPMFVPPAPLASAGAAEAEAVVAEPEARPEFEPEAEAEAAGELAAEPESAAFSEAPSEAAAEPVAASPAEPDPPAIEAVPPPVVAPAVVPARVERRGNVTWPASILQHDEAKRYDEAARRDLIAMMTDLADPKFVRVLHDALYEEHAEGLRPLVLSAFRRAYHGEAMRDTYERFGRIGSPSEREIVREALLDLDAGGAPLAT